MSDVDDVEEVADENSPAPVRKVRPVRETSEAAAPPPRVREAPPKPVAAPPAPALDFVTVPCPNCGTQYRLAAANVGKKARCRDCQTVFPIVGPS